MIRLMDSIRYQNVVAKNYYFHYSNMIEVLEDFYTMLEENHLHPKGSLFYAMHNIPLDENMETTFFMPIREYEIPDIKNVTFYSYYDIEEMVSTIVYEDPMTHMEEGYGRLVYYMKKNNLKQVTPIYHVIKGDKQFPYVEIKIGYDIIRGEIIP
ncbi:DUF5085 family protein [Anaerosporobacter sp.]